MRIAVIGGGPGGAQCAARLAKGGADVTLFEPRDRFEKACGGGIPARGVDRFPFLAEARLAVRRVSGCLLVSPSGREARFDMREPLYVYARADLHAFMLERAVAAGARLVRARVAGFDRDTAGAWRLRTAGPDAAPQPSPYDYLIAADGAAGSARRRLLDFSGAAAREPLTQGIGYYVPGVSEDFITLKFYGDLHGYLWVFPRVDHSSAGICATLGARPAAELYALMDGFLAARYGAAALSGSTRYAALIPQAPGDAGAPPLQGPGWALIGDAARHVDPLTREGIYYAILSGDLLAAAILDRRPERYESDWRGEAAPELAWSAAHGDRFFERSFVDRMVRLCDVSPAVAGVLSDLIAGRQSYRTLKRRLVRRLPAVAAHLARRALGSRFRRARDS